MRDSSPGRVLKKGPAWAIRDPRQRCWQRARAARSDRADGLREGDYVVLHSARSILEGLPDHACLATLLPCPARAG